MPQSKVTVAAAAVAAVIAAGYPAASWYLGQQIEATHAEIDAKIAAIPYLKLVRHDYQRGLFSADETITIEIPASLFRMPTPRNRLPTLPPRRLKTRPPRRCRRSA